MAAATDSSGETVMVVEHDSAEQNGINHHCGVSTVSQACSCSCFNNEYYAMMPGLGNTGNFAIGTPAPTPRESVYSLESSWTMSDFSNVTHSAAWQWAMHHAVSHFLGVKPSYVTLSDVADVAVAGSILTGIGDSGYQEPLFDEHEGVSFKITVSHDLTLQKFNLARSQLEHLSASVEDMRAFQSSFSTYLASTDNTAGFPAAEVPTNFHIWLLAENIGAVTQTANPLYWVGKCKAGEYPYMSTLANQVDCLPCPTGYTSEAGDKHCFLYTN